MTYARRLQRLAISPSFRVTPLAASLWAQTIVRYWNDVLRHQEAAPALPFDVIDISPGNGESILLMLEALKGAMTSSISFPCVFRYLVLSADRAVLTELTQRAELKSWVDQGVCIPLLCVGGRPYLMRTGGFQRWQPQNPLVFVVQDQWRQLAHRLVIHHAGDLFEADLVRQARRIKAQENWKKISSQALPAVMREWFDRYLQDLNDVPLLVPVGAMQWIHELDVIAPRGYLMLASGVGTVSQRCLRLASLDEILHNDLDGVSRPINFCLLKQCYVNLGAAVWQKKMGSGLAIQVAMKGATFDQSRLVHVIQKLDEGDFADGTKLITAMTALGPEADVATRLALLRQSRFDPQVLLAAGKPLLGVLPTLSGADRDAWRLALQATWSHWMLIPDHASQYIYLANAAMQIAAWSLAKQVLRRGMAIYGEQARDLALLAWCEMRTGRSSLALPLARQAICADPESMMARQVVAQIEAKTDLWGSCGRRPFTQADGMLVMEPLDVTHAEALCHQYRDPLISTMTGLPALKTVEEVRAWITADHDDGTRPGYAVMHAEFGLIGYTAYINYGEDGFLCFWLGVDFQGLGLAGKVARLACAIARMLGLVRVFTAAYVVNVRSIRTLKAAGFWELPMRALAPADDRIFFCWGDHPGDMDDQKRALVEYYRGLKLPIEFVQG